MIINNNLTSVQANRMLKIDEGKVDKNMEKLSSGLRIVSGADDPSGLAVSEKMRSQVRGLDRASRNAADGISFIQTAEGYLGETTEILQRIREMSIQTANGIYTAEDRMQVQVELSQLVSEVDRIASHAQFNGKRMLTGSFSQTENGNPTGSMWLHVGANMDERVRLYIGTMSARALGLQEAAGGKSISLSTPAASNSAIGVVDAALKKVSKQRADLGAFQKRLEHVVKSNDIGSQNLLAAESRIRDLNMAKEVSDMVKNQVISQSAIAVLSQSNTRAQSVLRLLG